MTPDEELIRARQAQEALDNPLINEALDAFEQRITQTWQEATLNGPDAPRNLLHLRMMLDAAKTFRKYLLATVESGKVAEAVIRQERTLAERLKNPFGRR